MSLNNGFYESVINNLIDEEIYKLKHQKKYYIDKKQIDEEEGSSILSKYMSIVINKSLNRISDKDKLNKQIEICNKIIELLINELKLDDFNDFIISDNAELLLAVLHCLDNLLVEKNNKNKIRPITSLAMNSLFTGAKNEPSLGSELVKEINTAERIDMLVSFIKWSGLVQIFEALQEFTKEHKLRVITTSYMGATDYKAVLELSKLPNTEIKISYDTKRTRLHSKSYMFYRNTGFSTAFIGSSNLSNAALTSGLEWNLKKKCPHLLNEIISILKYNLENIDFKERDMKLGYTCPLKLHCRYSMAEVLAAFEEHKLDHKSSFREGVKYLEDKKTDIFFITLNKSEKDYSETTMYDDYAIDDEYFHWQSQSGTSDSSPTGQRYINHDSLGSKVVLFVRERKSVNGMTEPYYCLGTGRFVSYEGSKPMSIVWKLDNKMPEFIKKKASGNVMVG